MQESPASVQSEGRMAKARRVFIVVWVALGIAGALDQTVVPAIFGGRVDLLLPHLKYGHVMFNLNPHVATVYDYAGDDGVRRPLAELVHTPAFAHADSRLALNVILEPNYLREVCYRATRGTRAHYTFFVDDYDIDKDPRHPARSTTSSCDAHGLVAK
jgi:hypothetical protein